MTVPFENELLIDVRLDLACQIDEVINLSLISDTKYYIAQDGLKEFKPEWTHTVPACPVEYGVSRIIDGAERPLNSAEKLVLTHFSLTNGWLDLQTSDYALDGEVWSINLFMRSIYSNAPKRDGELVFEIEFRDNCWDSILEPAKFRETSATYDLW